MINGLLNSLFVMFWQRDICVGARLFGVLNRVIRLIGSIDFNCMSILRLKLSVIGADLVFMKRLTLYRRLLILFLWDNRRIYKQRIIAFIFGHIISILVSFESVLLACQCIYCHDKYFFFISIFARSIIDGLHVGLKVLEAKI